MTTRTRVLRDTRMRVLATVVGLLAASTVVSTLLLRELLLDRVDDRVQRSLVQEIDEFRQLARVGSDPETGRPFRSLQRLFDVYLDRNVPNRDEDWYTFVGTRLYETTNPQSVHPGVAADLEAGRTGTRRGEFERDGDGIAYLSVPVRLAGSPPGAFAVTAGIDGEREEVTEATQLAAGVALGVLAAASLVAFTLAGRLLEPLHDVTETARTISETDLTRRIEVEGTSEIATLARTFNEMLDRLEGAFASQRAFVSDAGHELRTPITVIRSHLELLASKLPAQRETFDLLTDELDRMSRIVDDLLTLAKSERDDFLAREDLDLDVLTEELHGKARALAARDWQIDAAAPGRITADRQRLTQALMNLAANAAQHTADGDRIAIGSALEDGEARLWVTDDGAGIAPADQERIFERFARGAGSGRRSDGAGLGLAIVTAIAEAHGGRVALDSTLGAGSTFTIHLPVEPDADAAEEGL